MATSTALVPGTYSQYPQLEPLPGLVRKQRSLEAQIVTLSPLIEDEKRLRKDIDALLIDAGIQPGDRVTCHGYDVMHHTRAGSSSLNADVLAAHLVAAGVSSELVDAVIVAATSTGEPAFWATVKPSKGAKVRAPLAGPSPNRKRVR